MNSAICQLLLSGGCVISYFGDNEVCGIILQVSTPTSLRFVGAFSIELWDLVEKVARSRPKKRVGAGNARFFAWFAFFQVLPENAENADSAKTQRKRNTENAERTKRNCLRFWIFEAVFFVLFGQNAKSAITCEIVQLWRDREVQSARKKT